MEGYTLKGWPSATSWAGTLHGGPSWACGAGSHHLSGAASMLALVCPQPQGVAFTDLHFPDSEIGPFHARAGKKHSTQWWQMHRNELVGGIGI